MGDRVDQHHQTGEVAAQARDGEVVALDPPGRKAEHGKEPHHLDHPHHGMLQGNQVVRAVPGLAMLVDLVFKAPLQPGFRRKGPHERQPFDGFTEQPCQLADLFLTLFGGRHHPGTKKTDQPDDQGRQQENGCGELPVEPEHVAEHRHQLQHAGEGVMHRLVKHFAHPIGILGEPVGEVPRR